MNTKLIAIGEDKYINPYYVVSLHQQADRCDNMRWWVRLRDGEVLPVDVGYIENLIRELT
jgi:hypothetical protein